MIRQLFTSILILTQLTVAAEVISPEAAIERVSDNPAASISKERFRGARLIQTERVRQQPTVYIFQGPENGLLLLSADDRAEALLGYTEDSAINPTLRWWIDEYSREIAWLRQNVVLQSIPEIKNEKEYEAINPLLTTKWNQDDPYNLKCPRVGFSRCVTGCTATAMAQVINYHRIPKTQGCGTISYKWNTETLSFDFDTTPFDWDNMLDMYDESATEEQEMAVANLMYACGVATQMDYGVWGSGANSETAIPVLIENFGFDKALHSLERRYYGLSEWNHLIYNQLAENGPVQYNGYNSEVGHSFVCDGYSSDGFFHINWGWGGMSDGYFRLTALDPDSQGIGGSTAGYDYGQSIMADFRAPVDGSEYYEAINVNSKLELSSKSLLPGSETILDGGFFYSGTQTAHGEIGYRLINDADNSERFYSSFEFELEPGYGYNSYPITIPDDIAEGSYRIYPAWKNSKGDVLNMPVDISYSSYISMVVKDGRARLSVNNDIELELTDITELTPFFTDKEFTVTGHLKNNSEREYYGLIFAALLSKNGDAHLASGGIFTVDLLGGMEEEITYKSTFSAVYDDKLVAGEYMLVFADQEGGIISEPILINVMQAPDKQGSLAISDFKFDGDSNHADAGDLNFSFTAKCVGGYYIGEIGVYIFPEYGGEAITGFLTPTLYLPHPESQLIKVHGSSDRLVKGTRYLTALFADGEYLETRYVYFTVTQELGVEFIECGVETVAREFYTLEGTKAEASSLQPGLYIVVEYLSDGTRIQYKRVIK